MAVLLSQCKWNNVIVSWYHDSNGDFCNSVLFKSPNIFNKDGLRPWFSSTHPFWSLYRPSYVQLRRNVYQLDTHFSWVQQNWFKLKKKAIVHQQDSHLQAALNEKFSTLNEKFWMRSPPRQGAYSPNSSPGEDPRKATLGAVPRYSRSNQFWFWPVTPVIYIFFLLLEIIKIF